VQEGAGQALSKAAETASWGWSALSTGATQLWSKAAETVKDLQAEEEPVSFYRGDAPRVSDSKLHDILVYSNSVKPGGGAALVLEAVCAVLLLLLQQQHCSSVLVHVCSSV
jgi:hypothetical protein